MIIIETAAEAGNRLRRKAGSPYLVKPSSYSSRQDVYTLVYPFFVRRKIRPVIRAEGIYGGNPQRVMGGSNGTKECFTTKTTRRPRGRREKVTGNFSTFRLRPSRVRANPCTPGGCRGTTGGNQKGLKPLQTAFSSNFRRFRAGYGPIPGQHCACRFLSILGVSVWNFSSNIGFIIPSIADQKNFKKAAPVAKSGINIVTFQYEPPHFIYVNFHVCHRY